jgi:surface polysaccharide O-acyltransferase-like enzyme
MALALFLLSRRWEKPWLGARFAAACAPLTLGIYLIHPAVLKGLALLHVEVRAFLPALSIPLIALLAAALSGLAAFGVCKIPGVRKIIGYVIAKSPAR